MPCRCLHDNAKKIIFPENSPKEVWTKLKEAATNTSGFTVVDSSETTNYLKVIFKTPVGWLDSVKFVVVPNENNDGSIAYTYGHSTNFCPGWCGCFIRGICGWFVFYSDNGQIIIHMTKLAEASGLKHEIHASKLEEFRLWLNKALNA
mmetsp:Transcript_4352/g.6099  ORF Transcript_4352/g.6099 Transcript_4352/m.6099 type:complete len:148 (-) Transcript_4352:68-511(-)